MSDFMCESLEFNGVQCKKQCASCKPRLRSVPIDYRKILLAFTRAVYFGTMRTYEENIVPGVLTHEERSALNAVLNETTARPTDG